MKTRGLIGNSELSWLGSYRFDADLFQAYSVAVKQIKKIAPGEAAIIWNQGQGMFRTVKLYEGDLITHHISSDLFELTTVQQAELWLNLINKDGLVLTESRTGVLEFSGLQKSATLEFTWDDIKALATGYYFLVGRAVDADGIEASRKVGILVVNK